MTRDETTLVLTAVRSPNALSQWAGPSCGWLVAPGQEEILKAAGAFISANSLYRRAPIERVSPNGLAPFVKRINLAGYSVRLDPAPPLRNADGRPDASHV